MGFPKTEKQTHNWLQLHIGTNQVLRKVQQQDEDQSCQGMQGVQGMQLTE